MVKENKKSPSVEELKALQEKVTRGETLTPEEQDLLLAAELEAEEAESNARDASRKAEQDEEIERIANIIAKKLQSGTVLDGGKPFVPKSEEEVAKMKKLSPEEKAKEYFDNADLKNFPWEGIIVSDDLQIFMAHVQGENAAQNHLAANPGMKAYKFAKPTE